MTAKHTPGPWTRDRTSGVRCDARAENGRKVALCWGLSTSRAAQMNTPAYKAECDANANLIAVAPTMFNFVTLIAGFTEAGRDSEDDAETLNSLIRSARTIRTQAERPSHSIARCQFRGCNAPIDTDLDDEAVQPDPRHSLAGHPDIIICKPCREKQLAEQERAP